MKNTVPLEAILNCSLLTIGRSLASPTTLYRIINGALTAAIMMSLKIAKQMSFGTGLSTYPESGCETLGRCAAPNLYDNSEKKMHVVDKSSSAVLLETIRQESKQGQFRPRREMRRKVVDA